GEQLLIERKVCRIRTKIRKEIFVVISKRDTRVNRSGSVSGFRDDIRLWCLILSYRNDWCFVSLSRLRLVIVVFGSGEELACKRIIKVFVPEHFRLGRVRRLYWRGWLVGLRRG